MLRSLPEAGKMGRGRTKDVAEVRWSLPHSDWGSGKPPPRPGPKWVGGCVHLRAT